MNNDLRNATWLDRLMLTFRRRIGFVVNGDSMLPTIADGDTALIDLRAPVAAGDIVVAEHPFKQSVKILKRVASIDVDGNYVLSGDNPSESTDSRSLGVFARRSIIGKAVCRLNLPALRVRDDSVSRLPGSRHQAGFEPAGEDKSRRA